MYVILPLQEKIRREAEKLKLEQEKFAQEKKERQRKIAREGMAKMRSEIHATASCETEEGPCSSTSSPSVPTRYLKLIHFNK